MLFYLAPSVASSLEKADQSTSDFLLRILDSRKRGHVLIHASRQTFARIEKQLLLQGRQHESDLISTLSKNFREQKQLARDLSKIIYVSNRLFSFREFGDKLLAASTSFLNETNMHTAPIMLGENLTDCELYVNGIARNFTEGLPESLKQLRLSERFENGGGNTTHTVYSHHKNREEDFCICVVDSDRNCPDEGLGDTAKFVVAVDKDSTSPFCSHVVIDMYSAENLLPIGTIESEFSEGKSNADITKFEIAKRLRETNSWRFLALKKGVKGKDLKDNSARANYWRERLKDAEVSIPCCDDNECKCLVLPPLNSKTLAKVVNGDSREWARSLNSEANLNIKHDYLRISYILRSWLCVGREIRL